MPLAHIRVEGGAACKTKHLTPTLHTAQRNHLHIPGTCPSCIYADLHYTARSSSAQWPQLAQPVVVDDGDAPAAEVTLMMEARKAELAQAEAI